MQKTEIGIGHVFEALQRYGFRYTEIMAMREAMLTDDFSNVEFLDDCYSENWPDAKFKRMGLDGRSLESKMPLSVEVDERTLKLFDELIGIENGQTIVAERMDRTKLFDCLVKEYADKTAEMMKTLELED